MGQEAKPLILREARKEGAAEQISWVKPVVWSERMLEALERGVPGNAWYTLIDKVYQERNLLEAYERVKRNGGSAGVDHVSVKQFSERLQEELSKLAESIKAGSYRPQAIKRVYIPKAGGGGGERPLGIPSVRDRVVQAAVRQVIEPIFDKEFLSCSYGFRPGRGCKDALRRVDELLHQGHTVVVDADIKGFFDTINHEQLIELVNKHIKDNKMIELLKGFLKQGILEDGQELDPAAEGTPQGGVISPLLANIYLHQLDEIVTKQGYQIVRYADDFVIMCKTQQEAEQALSLVQEVMEKIELKLHPDKTHVVNMVNPDSFFEFLGYRFKNHKGRILKYPGPKSINKLRDKIRTLTPRLSGASMECIVDRINPAIRGWFNYFKHSSSKAFGREDGWIRSRLRAILSRRRKSGSRNRYGTAHNRWPNKFFHDLGLYCIDISHANFRFQSASR
jgi:RNA-directed DNA polymerase